MIKVPSTDIKDKTDFAQATLTDRVASSIRDIILSGELHTGSKVTETSMATMLKVSRISIREAFVILENEGLLNKVINKYTEVISLKPNDIEEIYRIITNIALIEFEACYSNNTLPLLQLRERAKVLEHKSSEYETMPVACIIDNDIKFHEIIIRASGNDRAYKVWANFNNQLTVYINSIKEENPNFHIIVNKFIYSMIIDYVYAKAPDNAISILKQHFNGILSQITL